MATKSRRPAGPAARKETQSRKESTAQAARTPKRRELSVKPTEDELRLIDNSGIMASPPSVADWRRLITIRAESGPPSRAELAWLKEATGKDAFSTPRELRVLRALWVISAERMLQVEERRLRAKVEAGDGMALLEAIESACLSGQPLPDWLAGRLVDSIHSYIDHRFRTLDEAFNVSRPKGYHIKAARKKSDLAWRIWAEVRARTLPGDNVTRIIIAEVGEEHGVGGTLAAEYYQECEALDFARRSSVRK